MKEFRIVAALAIAVLTYAVSQTLLVPSLPEIERELGTSAVGATSLFSAFFVSGAVTCGIFGRLGDMFGKRRMIVVQMALFSLGALICALAPTLQLLILGRVVMGSSVGIFALSYAILRDELPTPRVPGAVTLIGGLGASGAALGQACGGFVTDGLGYRWIFWIGLITGLVSILVVTAFVPESSLRTRGRVDLIGAALLASGLAAPLIGISKAPEWGWAGQRTLALFATGIVLLSLFVVQERRHSDPLLHLPTLLLPRVRMANLATLLVGFGLFSASTIISQFVQVPKHTGFGFGASATQAGLFLVPGLLLVLVLAPAAGRLNGRAGPKVALVLGTTTGSVALAGLVVFHSHRYELYVWPTLMYVGVAFAFSAAPLLVLEAVPAAMRGQATAVNLILRNLGAAIGLQLAATFITASSRASGLPTDRGFTRAFGVQALGVCFAALIALRIPRSKPSLAEADAALEARSLTADRV